MQVNYILKEAYIAIPFSIKPSNITNIMGQNFKFKKGVLFQVSHDDKSFDGLRLLHENMKNTVIMMILIDLNRL